MRFRFENRWFDDELELFRDIAIPLDKLLLTFYKEDSEYADMFGHLETAEQLIGVGFVTAQVYINSCLREHSASSAETLSDSGLLKLGPKHSSGISKIKLIVHGANYWKHSDEWSPEVSNPSKDRILNTFESLGIGDEYPLYMILEHVCGKSKPSISEMVIILEDWHSALEEELKRVPKGDMGTKNEALPKGYLNHEVFGLLSEIRDFYEALAPSVFPFVSSGTNVTIGNIDTYVFSAAQGSVSSISQVLKSGRINDSYALLRKYYDTVVANLYTNILLKDRFGPEELIVTKVNEWLTGREKLPRFEPMLQHVCKATTTKALCRILGHEKYKALRDRCNDHTHFNSFQYLFLNDPTLPLQKKCDFLTQFKNDLLDVFTFHFAGIASISEPYFMASDYRDYLECGMTPELGSEHWPAPFVQRAFSVLIKPHRPDVADEIMNITSLELVNLNSDGLPESSNLTLKQS